MQRALDFARAGDATPGASPIGCVVVFDGKIVAEGHNEVDLRHDPTAHAEIVTIRSACQQLSRDDLRGATLYSTLQPCGMCTMASVWASIGRIVYGAGPDDVIGCISRIVTSTRWISCATPTATTCHWSAAC